MNWNVARLLGAVGQLHDELPARSGPGRTRLATAMLMPLVETGSAMAAEAAPKVSAAVR